MDLRKIFEYALQREYEGKKFFEQNAKRMSHAAAVSAFERIAREEQKHIDIIQAQINHLQNDKSAQSMDMFQYLYSPKSNIFLKHAEMESIDQTTAEAMVPDLPILRMAYLIERDFAEFYEGAAQKSEGEAREVLSKLSEWERGHERLFKLFHDRAFESYTQMPWGG